jgi:hypothetical protein
VNLALLISEIEAVQRPPPPSGSPESIRQIRAQPRQLVLSRTGQIIEAECMRQDNPLRQWRRKDKLSAQHP